MKLSDNLKNIRKENNLSQEQLAEKLGVSRQAVSKWESGQSYPEMDKVLMICKMFNYNIDELMNENIKEVNETKQAKNSINKYIEDFFSFITKTVDMLGAMKFKQKIKCFIEQLGIILFLIVVFILLGELSNSILSGLLGGLPFKAYHIIYNILKSIYIIIALFIGITILLHIFKIRYLDYYEIIKKDEDSNINGIEEKNDNNENKKIFAKKSKEKIIIRDPEHSQSKFLNGLIRIVLWCVKIFALLISIGFAFSFIIITALLVLSFLFVKTGLVFLGSLLALLSALIINFIILELLYNFIVSKKSKKNRISIMLLISLIFAGISIGVISIGVTQFDYIKDPQKANALENNLTIEMTDNLSINNFNKQVKMEYIETDNNEIKVTVNYSKFYNVNIYNRNETINIDIFQDDSRIMESIRDTIKDINNKEILDYHSPRIYIYASKDNIEKMQQNQYNKIEQNKLKK